MTAALVLASEFRPAKKTSQKMTASPVIYLTKEAFDGLRKQLSTLHKLATEKGGTLASLHLRMEECALTDEPEAWFAIGYLRAWSEWSGLPVSKLLKNANNIHDVSDGNFGKNLSDQGDLNTAPNALLGIKCAISALEELCSDEGEKLSDIDKRLSKSSCALHDCYDAWDLVGYCAAWSDWSGMDFNRLAKNFI